MQDHTTLPLFALKVCTKCEKEKPLTEFRFHNTGRMAGQPRASCAECDRESVRAYRQRARQKINEAYRERIAGDPDYRKKRNDKSRAWRQRNRDRIAEYNATRFDEKPEAMRAAIKASQQKYPDRHKARKAIQYAIKVGKLPPVWSMVCEDCQEAQAAHYHHHNGYDPEHKLDVIALCTECHGKAHWVD